MTTDQNAATKAVNALGSCLAAHCHFDLPAATIHLSHTLALVHRDGEEAARHRLAWLCIALAKMTAEAIQHEDCEGVYAIRREVGGHAFDELPECVQIALTAVVTVLNGDTVGATHLIHEYCDGVTSVEAAKLLAALISVHGRAERTTTRSHRGN